MPEKDLPAISRNLKKLREAAGMSQQELAGKAGISLSVIAQIEQGVIANPRVNTVTGLAEALGVTCDTLTGKSGRPRKGK